MEDSFRVAIIRYSREIVRLRGYSTDTLVFGLQPRSDVEPKLRAEWQELCDSDATDWIYRATNIGRYALILDVVAPRSTRPGWYEEAMGILWSNFGCKQDEVEVAMRIKYGMRQSMPYRGDEETTEERQRRHQSERAAINAVLDLIHDIRKDQYEGDTWPGWTLPEVSKLTDIPLTRLYNISQRVMLPEWIRKSGKATLVNMRHPGFQAFLLDSTEERREEPER